MSGIFLRILVYLIIFAIIYFGLKKIFTDWRNRFKGVDEEARKRDFREREREDVIDLKVDKDGVFRPKDRGGKGRAKRDREDKP